MTSHAPVLDIALRMTSHAPVWVRLGARATWRSQVSSGRCDAQTVALDRCQALGQRPGSRKTRSHRPLAPWRHRSLWDGTVACVESRTHTGPEPTACPRGHVPQDMLDHPPGHRSAQSVRTCPSRHTRSPARHPQPGREPRSTCTAHEPRSRRSEESRGAEEPRSRTPFAREPAMPLSGPARGRLSAQATLPSFRERWCRGAGGRCDRVLREPGRPPSA